LSKNIPIIKEMGNPEGRTQHLLIFRACGVDCALPLETVREIVPMATLFSPPGLPSGLAGFLDLRGTAIPILHFGRLFGLPQQLPGLHTPMIVLRGIRRPVGILAESVRDIVSVSSSQFVMIPADRTFQGCTAAAFQLDGGLIHLLSPAALLGANEDRLVADYGAIAEARRSLLEERF
jgi:purine-binding chemotaxis protein CheW